MDRDQEKFYEGEHEDQVQGASVKPSGEEPVDDMRFFIELLKALRDTITSGKNVPLTGRKMIDAEKCLMILDDMDNNLPVAIQYGYQMYSERERIMGNAETTAMNRVTSAEMRANATLEKARDEADRLIADAEDEARAIVQEAQDRVERMVEESEIVRQAREEARSIKNDAKVEVTELKLKVTHDVLQELTAVEDEMSAALNSIRRRRKELDEMPK
jgi:vacuolar-type H+-ATPase subunit H